MGMEQHIADSFRREMNGNVVSVNHRSVLIDLPGRIDPLKSASASLIDDIYYFHGIVNGIDHTRQCIKTLVDWIEENLAEALRELHPEHLRITVSFLGSRNYNRYFVESAARDLLQAHLTVRGLSNERGDSWVQGETRLRIHLEDHKAFIGIALKDKPIHRRSWRHVNYEGQLHPPLAACLSSFITKPVSYLIDPFAGSGTILLESFAFLDEGIPRIGYDIHSEAVAKAKLNAQIADVKVQFHQGRLYDHLSSYDDFGLVTNPPWGRKHDLEHFDDQPFWSEFTTLLKKANWSICLLPEAWKEKIREDGFKVLELFLSRVRGSLVHGILIESPK